MAYAPFLSFVILLLSPLSAWALESDRNQSVLVEADEVEIDFTNGKRIYTGNVSVRQGTIRIIADQIELFYDGEQLDHAVATGNPAVFRQRPDGKEHDVVGTGQTIELDEVNNIVTFITRAQLRQDRDAIEGEKIVYDMGRDRMIVRGGDEAPTRTTRAGEDATTVLKTKDNERPKMVLQPESSQSQNIAPRTDSPDVATQNDTQIAFIGNNGAPVVSKRSVTSTSLGTLPKGTAIRVLRSTQNSIHAFNG
jgi:lipopolysaccharide export system protein LptA